MLRPSGDDCTPVAVWREELRQNGVWANDPALLLRCPDAPDYRKLLGLPDDAAWERAHTHTHTHAQHDRMSDIHDPALLSVSELEAAHD